MKTFPKKTSLLKKFPFYPPVVFYPRLYLTSLTSRLSIHLSSSPAKKRCSFRSPCFTRNKKTSCAWQNFVYPATHPSFLFTFALRSPLVLFNPIYSPFVNHAFYLTSFAQNSFPPETQFYPLLLSRSFIPRSRFTHYSESRTSLIDVVDVQFYFPFPRWYMMMIWWYNSFREKYCRFADFFSSFERWIKEFWVKNYRNYC